MRFEDGTDTFNVFEVKNKVVLVTGGGRGIGEMIASGFVQNGCKVYIASRQGHVCEQVAQQLTAQGPGMCIGLGANLATADGIQSLVTFIQAKEKALHVLVNNAGAVWAEPMDDYSDEAFAKILRLNLQFLPLLRKGAQDPENPSRVINIGSINGIVPPAPLETYAYSASKAAVHMLSKHMALRLAQDHITVNAIAPGAFPSRMMKHVLERMGDALRSPLGRIGTPEDVAGTCLWLSSRAGAHITASVVVVDGGQMFSGGLTKL